MTEALINGVDIAKILSSTGPVVKCVILRAQDPAKDDDKKKPPVLNGDGKGSSNDDDDDDDDEVDLSNLIEEIELDTTPGKSMVLQTLGGPFTFLGQYEEEGIFLMIRKPDDDSVDMDTLNSSKLSELRALCKERKISMTGMLTKQDLVHGIIKFQAMSKLPPNPHKLQPPFDKEDVRGDILILKVTATEEELDKEDAGDGDDDNDAQEADSKGIEVPTNEEFFLDYTKESYLTFAARTDVVPPEVVQAEEDSEGELNEDQDASDDEEDEWSGGEGDGAEDGDIGEEDKAMVLNMLMSEVLRQYREEHGRGPDTRELLGIRSAIAQQLEVDVPEIDAEQADWSQKAKKRNGNKKGGDDDDSSDGESKRKVVFSPEVKKHDGEKPSGNNNDSGMAMEDGDKANDDDDDDDDGKPPAKKSKPSPDKGEEDDGVSSSTLGATAISNDDDDDQ